MLKIAICDDCSQYQLIIKKHLEISSKLNIEYEISFFSSGVELMRASILNEINLIFLDIVMEDMDGISVLSYLKNSPCYIIFMSTTSDRLRELFQKNVLAFLDKPINQNDFDKSIEEFLKIHEKEQEKIFVIEKLGIPKNIPEAEIIYFENLGHYIHLHTIKEVIIFKEKISQIWQTLEENTAFAMPNRSYIINLKYSGLSSKNMMKVGTESKKIEVSIGRTKKEDTLQRLISYANEKGGK